MGQGDETMQIHLTNIVQTVNKYNTKKKVLH